MLINTRGHSSQYNYIFKWCDETYKQLLSGQLQLSKMSLEQLKKFQVGLSIFKRGMVEFRDVVGEEINRQESRIRKAPTTAEKAAMGIIFVCLVGIITGAYSLSQIQQLQTEWLKWLLISDVLGVGLLVLIVICKWIWPRRKINQFEGLLEKCVILIAVKFCLLLLINQFLQRQAMGLKLKINKICQL